VENINLCYQCKKCAAGCPVGQFMDYKNYEILRLLQLNQKNTALAANSLWLCTNCRACSERCPNGIDTAKIMDILKQEALQSQSPVAEPGIVLFHRIFLAMIRYFGRSYELGLMGLYKLGTGGFWQELRSGALQKDLLLGAKMFRRFKLPLLPHRSKGIKQIRQLFSQSRENGQ